MKKSKKGTIDVFTFFLVLYFLMDYSSYIIADNLRYLKYLIPIFCIFLPNKTTKDDAYKFLMNFIKLYSFIFLFFLFEQIFTLNLTQRYFANVYFILAPLLFVFFMLPHIKQEKITFYFYFLVVGSILGYFLEKGAGLIDLLTHFSLARVSLEDSTSETESNIYPFVFAFSLVYAIYYKYPKMLSAVIALVVLLGFKRIVFSGLIIIILTWVLFKITSFKAIQKRRKFFSFAIATIATFVIIIYFKIANGDFDNYVLNHYGISVNFLMQGRQYLYTTVLHKFNDAYLLGMGLGTTDNIVTKYFASTYIYNPNLTVMHSELLRTFLETGVVFYFIWIYFFAKNSINNLFSFLVFLFLFGTLLTDNILRYFDCMFVYYLLVVFSLKTDEYKRSAELAV